MGDALATTRPALLAAAIAAIIACGCNAPADSEPDFEWDETGARNVPEDGETQGAVWNVTPLIRGFHFELQESQGGWFVTGRNDSTSVAWFDAASGRVERFGRFEGQPKGALWHHPEASFMVGRFVDRRDESRGVLARADRSRNYVDFSGAVVDASASGQYVLVEDLKVVEFEDADVISKTEIPRRDRWFRESSWHFFYETNDLSTVVFVDLRSGLVRPFDFPEFESGGHKLPIVVGSRPYILLQDDSGGRREVSIYDPVFDEHISMGRGVRSGAGWLQECNRRYSGEPNVRRPYFVIWRFDDDGAKREFFSGRTLEKVWESPLSSVGPSSLQMARQMPMLVVVLDDGSPKTRRLVWLGHSEGTGEVIEEEIRARICDADDGSVALLESDRVQFILPDRRRVKVAVPAESETVQTDFNHVGGTHFWFHVQTEPDGKSGRLRVIDADAGQIVYDVALEGKLRGLPWLSKDGKRLLWDIEARGEDVLHIEDLGTGDTRELLRADLIDVRSHRRRQELDRGVVTYVLETRGTWKWDLKAWDTEEVYSIRESGYVREAWVTDDGEDVVYVAERDEKRGLLAWSFDTGESRELHPFVEWDAMTRETESFFAFEQAGESPGVFATTFDEAKPPVEIGNAARIKNLHGIEHAPLFVSESVEDEVGPRRLLGAVPR